MYYQILPLKASGPVLPDYTTYEMFEKNISLFQKTSLMLCPPYYYNILMISYIS